MLRRLVIATLLVVGCHGKGEGSPLQAQNKAPEPSPGKLADAKPPAPPPPAKKEPPPTTPAKAAPEAKAAPPPAAPDKKEGKAGDPLGQRFIDPPWFRKTLFDGASLFRASRGEADENGLFASQMTFNLPEGQSVKDCERLMNEKIGKHVGKLEREEKAEGKRVFLRATTDRMKVTLVCGDARGTTRAYVAYEWTS